MSKRTTPRPISATQAARLIYVTGTAGVYNIACALDPRVAAFRALSGATFSDYRAAQCIANAACSYLVAQSA